MSIWDRRIPTFLGLTVILIGIGITSYLTLKGISPFSHASAGENPQAIRMTNITDTSFTVTYTTSIPIIGSLNSGPDTNLGTVILDDRDQATGIPGQYTLHSITVRNLRPSTRYFFSITSGSTTYLNQNNPFVIITAPHISAAPSTEVPLIGSVQLPTGESPPEAIVYVSTQNGQTLSTLTKSNGSYSIPLSSMRNIMLSSYISFSDATTLQVLAIDASSQSRITLFAHKGNPVPLIVLSNNYDFTLNTTPLASTAASFIGFPAFALDKTIQAEPIIETPSNNQNFSDSQPVLHGKALPNQTVKIIIHSQVVQTVTVTTDQYGNWTYRPSSPLPPGQHTITVTTPDGSGILRTIQQAFSIFASGTQVAEAATPSATPTVGITVTPTQVPTNTPTPQPTLSLSPSPTLTPTVTPTQTPTPTNIPSPTLTISPIPKPTIPPTGSNALITTGIAMLVTTATGIVLFLFI